MMVKYKVFLSFHRGNKDVQFNGYFCDSQWMLQAGDIGLSAKAKGGAPNLSSLKSSCRSQKRKDNKSLATGGRQVLTKKEI